MFGKKADDKIAKKQAEQEAKDKAAMEKFGVDFDSYTSEDIKEKNVASLKEIASSLAGSKMYSFGSLLSGNSNETFALEMSRAQVEQNFILMRQNEEIIRLLKQIAEKQFSSFFVHIVIAQIPISVMYLICFRDIAQKAATIL